MKNKFIDFLLVAILVPALIGYFAMYMPTRLSFFPRPRRLRRTLLRPLKLQHLQTLQRLLRLQLRPLRKLRPLQLAPSGYSDIDH